MKKIKCIECGKLFVPSHNSKMCSPECQYERVRIQAKSYRKIRYQNDKKKAQAAK